ncbi:MAG: glycosyltransferase [Patescibacteria group bacterium]
MSRVLITIPAWNEAVVIERNLRIVHDAIARLFPHDTVTVEVADNGSTDATREIVRRVGRQYPEVTLLEVLEKGKGIAIRTSWMKHLDDSDVLVFMDADLAADLEALPRLVAPIISQKADLVCGSRFLRESKIKRTWPREAASRLYRGLQRLLLQLPVKDAQCGFKAISVATARELLPLCEESGWLFDSELLAFARLKHKKTLELAISWIEYRDPSRRSALRLFHHGWGFMAGLCRIHSHVSRIANKMA